MNIMFMVYYKKKYKILMLCIQVIGIGKNGIGHGHEELIQPYINVKIYWGT